MAKYEYKTVVLQQKGLGFFSSREIPDLGPALNNEAKDGWRLKETILPSGAKGESDKIILIFERELPSS